MFIDHDLVTTVDVDQQQSPNSEKVLKKIESRSKLILAADSGHDPRTLPIQSAFCPPPTPHTTSTSTQS